MFDPNVLNLSSADKQRDAIGFAVQTAIDSGVFNYTEVWGWREPIPTMAMEYLDGIKVQNNVPLYGVAVSTEWEGNGILLVHKEASGHIKANVKRRVRVPGTAETREVEEMKDFGNFALVPDAPRVRTARHVLFHEGYPIVDSYTKGARNGKIVEWRWLEKEVQSPSASPEDKELHAEILSRPGFVEALARLKSAAEPMVPQNQPKKRPGDARPGATP